MSRPIGWLVQPLFLALGYFSALGFDQISPILISQLLLFTFPYNFILYGVNDVFDYESDLRNPRKGGVEGAILDKKYHKPILILSLIFGIVLFIPALILGNWLMAVCTSLLLFFSVFYSAPPIRFKELPILDSISNGLLYFLFPFFIGYSYFGSLENLPSQTLYVFLCAVAVHAVSTITDYELDKEMGINTIAVKVGPRPVLFFALILGIFSTLAIQIPQGAEYLYIYLLACIFMTLHLLITPEGKLANNYGKYVVLPGLIIVGFLSIYFAYSGQISI
jgi:4-hydroxybenzoate polyprenyltransferase